MKKRLTPRQSRFVAEYLITLNATQAALKAGYSAKTAEHCGPRLLGIVGVASAIQDSLAKRAARTEVTADRVVTELARIAFGDVGVWFDDQGRLKPIHELPIEARAALASVDVQREKTTRTVDGTEEVTIEDCVVKVKAWDKVRALELLAKHLGIITERREITGAQGGPLTFTLTLERPPQAIVVGPLALPSGNGNGNGSHG